MVFRQIADVLRKRISSGEYPKGGMLPSEMDLSCEFGAARTTIRRALVLMEGEGLIIAIPAKGRVVKGGGTAPLHRYQKIANDLREEIDQGDLPPGTAIPSEMALQRKYGVSRRTVRRALADLEREKLITVRHGSGRYVRLPEMA